MPVNRADILGRSAVGFTIAIVGEAEGGGVEVVIASITVVSIAGVFSSEFKHSLIIVARSEVIASGFVLSGWVGEAAGTTVCREIVGVTIGNVSVVWS